MFILLNPKSGNGTANRKWRMLYPELANRGIPISVHCMDGERNARHVVSEALNQGETEFAAAGGDGTVNALLTALLDPANKDRLQNIRIGGIGLGSSNDFHKSVPRSGHIGGIPCRIDFASAEARDIGSVKMNTPGGYVSRYFLNNASIGVTAEANAVFNNPGKLLRLVRRANTRASIYFAAFQSIVRYKPLRAFLTESDGRARIIRLSNFAAIKNPNISGNLRYDLPERLDDGMLRLVLCEDRSRIALLKLLQDLGNNTHHLRLPLETWNSNLVRIEAASSFAVEFDGEVLSARGAEFSLFPRQLRVCQC